MCARNVHSRTGPERARYGGFLAEAEAGDGQGNARLGFAINDGQRNEARVWGTRRESGEAHLVAGVEEEGGGARGWSEARPESRKEAAALEGNFGSLTASF